MDNDPNWRSRLDESHQNYVEREEQIAQEATRKETEKGVHAVQMEFKVLEMNRKKQEEEMKNLKQEVKVKNEELLSAAMKSGEKTKDEHKKECYCWEDKLKVKQEKLEKIRVNGEKNEEKITEEKKEIEKIYGEKKEIRQTKFFNDTIELKDQNGQIRQEFEKRCSQLAEEQRNNLLSVTNQSKALMESKTTAQVALLEAGRRDQSNSTYSSSADKLRDLFQTVQRIISSQKTQLSRTLSAMKRGQKLVDKPDMEQVTYALSDLEFGIQTFNASNSELRDLQKEVLENVSELTGIIANINTGIHDYEARILKTSEDFTVQYENANKVLLELSKLFLSFNINEESHTSKVISEHLRIAQSGNAFALKGRESDGQITDGQGQFSLDN